MTPTPAMLAQQPKQYEGRDLRNAISQILVKNGMITNQVAIGELWELMLNVAVRNEQEAGRIAIEQTRQQVRDEAFSDAAEKLRVIEGEKDD